MTPTQKKLKIQRKGFIKASEAALGGHPQSELFQKAFHKHQVLAGWANVVSQFFEDAHNQTKATDFKDGILFIACLSRELAYKIKMFAQRILYVLNQAIGKQLVYALSIDY